MLIGDLDLVCTQAWLLQLGALRTTSCGLMVHWSETSKVSALVSCSTVPTASSREGVNRRSVIDYWSASALEDMVDPNK